MNFRLLFAAPSLAVALALTGCGGGNTNAPGAASPTNAETVDTKASSDIVDTAAGAGSFKTLVAAVKAADLVDTLKGPGPFTVFAPTDEAFAKLPAGTLDDLLKPENKDKLKAILTYHVVSGKVMAAQVTSMSSAASVQGKDIKISTEGGAVTLNASAKVTKADIACSNGVIHVIDTVILPD